MRTIIPTTLADLPGMADYAGPGAEFFVKEIDSLDKWRKGVPHLPHNRVWCGFNSFNIPSADADRALLSLQGAGDLLFLSQFIHDIGDLSYVTCYRQRVGILGKTIPTLPIERTGPTEIRFSQIRHTYAYVANHPMVLQSLAREAMSLGWDHYDWLGLMLGIAPREKWVHIDWDPHCVDGRWKDGPLVGVHLKASTEDRSVTLEWPLSTRPVILGDGRKSYHETYQLVRQLDAVVAVDSVVLHMAVVARPDLPVLGLYTTTPTTWIGPDRPGVDRIHIDKSDSSRYHKEVSEWLRQHT